MSCTLRGVLYWEFALALKSSASPAKKALEQAWVGFRQLCGDFPTLIPKALRFECPTCLGKVLLLQMVASRFLFRQGVCITRSLITLNPQIPPSTRHIKVTTVIFSSLLRFVHTMRLVFSFIRKKAIATAWRCFDLGLGGRASANHESVYSPLCANEATVRATNYCGIDNA